MNNTRDLYILDNIIFKKMRMVIDSGFATDGAMELKKILYEKNCLDLKGWIIVNSIENDARDKL